MFLFQLAQGIFEINSLYIDPTATTILATSISGIVIAVGATAVILWRKAKKKAALLLKINELANKEVEEDLVINEDADEAEERAQAEENVGSDIE